MISACSVARRRKPAGREESIIKNAFWSRPAPRGESHTRCRKDHVLGRGKKSPHHRIPLYTTGSIEQRCCADDEVFGLGKSRRRPFLVFGWRTRHDNEKNPVEI